MASDAKRKTLPDDEMEDRDDVSENSTSDIDEEMIEDEEVQMDFEAKSPTDNDFDGIEKLLNQLFIKPRVDVQELTELIIQEASISSVIKLCDVQIDDDDDEVEDETFGVISVISLNQKHIKCVKEIISLLLEEAKSYHEKNVSDNMKALLENPNKQVGLLLSERIVNIPPQISVPMYDTLRKDLQNAQKKSSKYKFTDFIMISKVHKMNETTSEDEQNNHSSVFYSNAEDEIFKENGKLLFEYSVCDKTSSSSSSDDESDLQPARNVLHLSAESFDNFTSKLSEAFG